MRAPRRSATRANARVAFRGSAFARSGAYMAPRIFASVVEVMMRRILPCGDRSVYVPRFTLAVDRDRLAHAGRLLRADVLVLRLSRPAPRGVPVVARRGRGRLLALGGRAGIAVP